MGRRAKPPLFAKGEAIWIEAEIRPLSDSANSPLGCFLPTPFGQRANILLNMNGNREFSSLGQRHCFA